MQVVLLLFSVRSMDWMFSFLRTGKNDAKRVSCSSADAACQHPMEDPCKTALCNYAVKIFVACSSADWPFCTQRPPLIRYFRTQFKQMCRCTIQENQSPLELLHRLRVANSIPSISTAAAGRRRRSDPAGVPGPRAVTKRPAALVGRTGRLGVRSVPFPQPPPLRSL